MKVINFSVEPSIINQYLQEIRDISIQKDRMRFVANIERVGEILGYEISKELNYSSIRTTTQFGIAATQTLSAQPVLATILRAGLPFHKGFSRVFDHADSSFIASYRKLGPDGKMTSIIGYVSCPKLDGRPLIIIDPMIATGTSIVDAYNELMKYGRPSQVVFAGLVTAKPAIAYMEQHLPDIKLYTAALDDELNDEYFIVPGLGDAGDLIYGEKLHL